jgi:predicted nucleic acid-binding protein
LVNLVLDASAGFELLLGTTTGNALLHKLPPQAEWWVPEHYFVETASAIRRAENLGAVTATRAGTAVQRLFDGTVRRAQVRPLLREAWRRRGHLTIPDGLYVVLAEQLQATLVTADLRLSRSPGLPVPTITP